MFIQADLYLPGRLSILHSNFLSLAAFLPPLPFVFNSFKYGPTAFSSPGRPASHLLLT